MRAVKKFFRIFQVFGFNLFKLSIYPDRLKKNEIMHEAVIKI